VLSLSVHASVVGEELLPADVHSVDELVHHLS
jgi:hypothetical protein